MKIFLITTTIHVPHVLKQYEQIAKRTNAPLEKIIIAGDLKTPKNIIDLVADDKNKYEYLPPEAHSKYVCSASLGWNKIMRRNIAILRAFELGKDDDIIISIDDDNFPISDTYYHDFIKLFEKPFSGAQIHSCRYFNIGDLFDSHFYHRGFPYDKRHDYIRNFSIGTSDNLRVGIAAGLWLGDPDIDAMSRITNRPIINDIPELARNGIMVNPSNTWTVTNSQNTAYPVFLAPLMAVWPYVGRYDDIWASYFAQSILKEYGYGIHFGNPLCYQSRNPHNLWTDVRDELFGMEYTPNFIDLLQNIPSCDNKDGIYDESLTKHMKTKFDYIFDDIPMWGDQEQRENTMLLKEFLMDWTHDIEIIIGIKKRVRE